MKFVVKNLIGYFSLDLLYQSGIIVFLFNTKLKYPNDTIPFFGLEIPIFVILIFMAIFQIFNVVVYVKFNERTCFEIRKKCLLFFHGILSVAFFLFSFVELNTLFLALQNFILCIIIAKFKIYFFRK